MNKTKIDWATMSWNPLTGCRHGCPYCYARRTAHRFDKGLEDPAPLSGGLHVLEEKIKGTPYPYGFEPTLHRYRLNQPERMEEPQTVFSLPSGEKMMVELALMDSGDQTDAVYEFCLINAEWVRPCKGVPTMQGHYRISTVDKAGSRANG